MSATVSARQAATLCNVSGTTVQRWIASGRLRAALVDGAYRIAVEDLAPFQARHRATGAPDTGATVQADTPTDTVAPPDVQINVQRVAPEASDPSVAELVSLVREQAERLEKYAGQIGFLQARVQELERENLLLKEPIPHSETASWQTAHHPTAECAPRRPWWALWRWIVPSEG